MLGVEIFLCVHSYMKFQELNYQVSHFISAPRLSHASTSANNSIGTLLV